VGFSVPLRRVFTVRTHTYTHRQKISAKILQQWNLFCQPERRSSSWNLLLNATGTGAQKQDAKLSYTTHTRTHTEIASKERGRQQERCGAQSGAFKSSSETNKWRPTWGLKEYDIKQRTSKGRTFICKTMSRIIHYPELLSYLISFRNYFLSVHGLFGGQVKRQGGGAEGEETRM